MTRDEAREIVNLLQTLKEYTEVDKIVSTFIPAFQDKVIHQGDYSYLLGSFNLGGTKSARLSSSKPNLQQIPSTGTVYANIIKSCFQAPPGWLMVGADYASLEDMVSALQTKDANKLKVYTDGYDGHCLRAYAYFSDQMPDIDPNSVSSINSIESKHGELRQASKTPTFALTYKGTYRTLMANCGFSEDVAKQIENNYHKLYQASDIWVNEKLKQAAIDGYVTLAFGARLRTPILKQVVFTSESTMPYEAHKEMKTAGNALTQSYGLLNTRAANRFMAKVWKSKYREDIRPIAHIHDAQYYLIRNTLPCLHWVNKNLIPCMCDDPPPELQHPKVKLKAQLEIYYPSWADKYKIPNNISLAKLRQLLKKYKLRGF